MQQDRTLVGNKERGMDMAWLSSTGILTMPAAGDRGNAAIAA